MPKIAYVNGRYVPHNKASVHIEDRGFQFADSVYEVIACLGGEIADMRGHLDRLERSLAELRIDLPVRRHIIPLLMRELLRRNRIRDGLVYIQISRGSSPRDFKFPSRPVAPSFVMTARPYIYDAVPIEEKGIKVITVPDLRWKRCDIKTTNLLAPVLARQDACESGAAEAWLVDENGFITEGAASNAWIVTRDNCLLTRQVGSDILRGVTRTALAAIAREENLTLEERAFTPQEACEAMEAFCTAATIMISPVTNIDGHTIGTGKAGRVAARLYHAYRDYVRSGPDAQRVWTA
jgi:D-alanine transaminase